MTGRVIDPLGVPIDSGYVSVGSQGPDYAQASMTFSDGTYSLLLPAGTYSFFAMPDFWSGFPGRRVTGVSVTSDATIDIQLEGNAISGTVVGPDGLPMEGVRVETEAAQNRTKVDGTYRLYVPSGTYSMWFRPPYPYYIFPQFTYPVTVTGPATIDCDLRGVEWAGTVRRLGTGDPVPDITLIVTQVGDTVGRSASIASGPQGEFRFILEPGHAYDLKTYDIGTHNWTLRLQGVAATADTTFEILVP